MTPIGQEIRRRRESKDMSMVTLANAAGLCHNTVFCTEKGQCNPRYSTILKLLAVLGSTLEIVDLPKE